MLSALLRSDGVQGIAEQIDEDLEQTVRVADDAMLGDCVVQEFDVRGFFVDGDQSPGFIDQGRAGPSAPFAFCGRERSPPGSR